MTRWKARHTCIGSSDVNIGFDEICISLNGNNVTTLFCNHEEEDTELISNTKQISQEVIHTPDNDRPNNFTWTRGLIFDW